MQTESQQPQRTWSFYGCKVGDLTAQFAVHDDADDRFSRKIRAGWKVKPNARLAIELVGPDDTFIDIGANIGTVSIPVTLATGAACLDVEALPSNVELLRAALAKNGITNHRIESVAAHSERARLHIKGTTAFGTVAEDSQGVEIPALPLDDVIVGTPFEAARLVKMDIEGSEFAALAGMHRTLQGGPDFFIFEANGAHCLRTGHRPADLLRFFEGRGYANYLIRGGRLIPRLSTDFQEGGNEDYLATKPMLPQLDGFRVEDATPRERIERVLTTASQRISGYRAFIGAELEHAPAVIRDHPDVVRVIETLANDPAASVRDAIAAWRS